MNTTLTATKAPGRIRPGLTMSKMGMIKPKPKEKPIDDETFAIQKLDYLRQYWDSMEPFRRQRERAVKYFSGDQWHELREDDYGDLIREDDYLSQQGQTPLKQNLIKPAIRSLLGLSRTDTSKSVVVAVTPEKAKDAEMLSSALNYGTNTINNIKELDARALEELLNSGLPIQKVVWKYDDELRRKELEITNMDTTSAFFNGDMKDIRCKDLKVLGFLHDYTMDELIVDFGSTPERVAKLKEIYSHAAIMQYVDSMGFDQSQYYSRNFYTSTDISKCRVIEAWEKRLVQKMLVHDWKEGEEFYADWDQKKLDEANAFRAQAYAQCITPEYPTGIPAEEVPPLTGTIENVLEWFYTYYSPYGHILREGVTPFDHGSHPYILLPYSLLDGKIVGLTTDLIDAQRQVNNLLILQNMLLASSIKNTLVVDKNSMDGKSPEQIGEAYRKIGGVVVWDSGQGGLNKPPQELKGSIGNLGISEFLQIYIKLMQDVSGVNPAMQGQTAQSGTSGKLYDAQIAQSSLNSKDIMESFTGLFRSKRDWKALKTFQQYCDEPRMLAIAGKAYTETAKLYDPKIAKEIDFNLVLGQTNDSPVYKSIMEDTLTQFVMKGLIDIEMWAENTTMPFATSFLESIRKRKEQVQAGDPRGAVAGLAQDAQAAGVGGDPRVVDMVSQGLKQQAA